MRRRVPTCLRSCYTSRDTRPLFLLAIEHISIERASFFRDLCIYESNTVSALWLCHHSVSELQRMNARWVHVLSHIVARCSHIVIADDSERCKHALRCTCSTHSFSPLRRLSGRMRHHAAPLTAAAARARRNYLSDTCSDRRPRHVVVVPRTLSSSFLPHFIGCCC